MKAIADILREAAFRAVSPAPSKRLTGDDVERLLTTPQKDFEEVKIHETPVRGYLMSDGRWLGIGGHNDHRFINGMVEFDDATEESFGHSQTKKMLHIMKSAGLIRYIPESNMFQVVSKPTREQIRELFKFCQREGKIEVEFGVNAPSKEYSGDYVEELEEDLKNYAGI